MRKHGFTLAELLIALAILGVIATFTIPKVLQSQQDTRAKAIVKESLASVSAAYQAYQLNNQPGATTGMNDLTPFLNYVKLDSTSSIDFAACASTTSCGGAGYTCYRLHNGAILYYANVMLFGGTATTNALKFLVDPDGTATGASGDTGKSVGAYLYYSGVIRTRGDIYPNATWSTGSDLPQSSCEPSWWSWN